MYFCDEHGTPDYCPECIEESKWKPITSAPDDKKVLVTRDFNNAPIGMARWDGKMWKTGPSSMDFYASPTHWHELPDNIEQRK